jgi:lipopolysaccharide/colanic/teichoic acid biosynthesis glycosyltransferase
VFLFPTLGLQKIENALMVGASDEIDDLVEALRSAHHAPARIAAVVNPAQTQLVEAVKAAIAEHHPGFIIADFNNKAVSGVFPELYNYTAQGIRFFDALTLYEEVFGRVPLSILDERWVARNVSRYSRTLYDSFKRLMDIIIALPAAIFSLVLYPFIAAAIKLQDGGPVFIMQERVGEDNERVRVYKFRSMMRNEVDLMKGMEQNSVTTVGKFLRLTRVDELPQLWSVVRGELSFIGPRPELPSGVTLYEKEIPYYGVRHLVRPGLSGWAQLYHDNHPHHGAEVEATREKLSYDLYYVKHRSLLLDLVIALKTIKKLLTRSGV